jgi:hypothetical protein
MNRGNTEQIIGGKNLNKGPVRLQQTSLETSVLQ